MLPSAYPPAQVTRFMRSPSMQNANKTEHTLADLFIHYLQLLGVEYVFGIPGGAIEPLYNALARWEEKHQDRNWKSSPAQNANSHISQSQVSQSQTTQSQTTHSIVARHEAGAVFMADGYARATGKIGVCCATTGPGATNLITGVASAYENRIPLLVITAQTASKNFGRGAFQESSDTGINIIGMMQFCTAYNSLVSHPEQFEPKLITALSVAYREMRPVHLSVPLDIFRGVQNPAVSVNLSSLLRPRHAYDEDDLNKLMVCLGSAKKTVFVVGRDCQQAIAPVLRVVEQMDATFVTTPDAKLLVNPYHPQYRGVIGFAGHDSAIATVQDPCADTVVLLGASLSEWCAGPLLEKLPNKKVIAVQESHIYLSRSPTADLHIQGNIQAIFDHIAVGSSIASLKSSAGSAMDAAYNPSGENTEDAEYSASVVRASGKKLPFQQVAYTLAEDWIKAPVKPQWLMSQLPVCFPAGSEFLADTGNSTAWAIHYLHAEHKRTAHDDAAAQTDCNPLQNKHHFLQVTIEFAAMGWAIGAAVGMALARKNTPVVCITGDGSCLMNGQEMTVAQQHGLPVAFIILNDGHLGMVKHGQKLAGAAAIGTDLPAVDFAQLAAAMGIEGHTIRCPADWYRLNLKSTWKRTAPILLNVQIDPREVPPIGSRINALAADG